MSDAWVENAGPRLLAAVPCEDAAVSAALGDGRATIQRLFYDLYAARFPAAFDRLTVATVWMGGEGGNSVGARLSAPDGSVVAEAEMQYTARPQPATAVLLMHFAAPLVFPEPGPYTVDILLQGVPVFAFPLFAMEPPVAGRDAEAGNEEN
jgi:hypothetical protein